MNNKRKRNANNRKDVYERQSEVGRWLLTVCESSRQNYSSALMKFCTLKRKERVELIKERIGEIKARYGVNRTGIHDWNLGFRSCLKKKARDINVNRVLTQKV